MTIAISEEQVERAAIGRTKLKGCPFCGTSPHHGLGKVYYCQLHGDPLQDFIIKCPKGHAKIIRPSEELARIEWNTRAALEAAALGGAGWQPIETAPKDGTHISLYEPHRGQFEGWWHDAWPRACEEYWMDYADSEPEPTHWMPLPAAPSGIESGSEA